jgi:hypothetical protein
LFNYKNEIKAKSATKVEKKTDVAPQVAGSESSLSSGSPFSSHFCPKTASQVEFTPSGMTQKRAVSISRADWSRRSTVPPRLFPKAPSNPSQIAPKM